MANVLLCGNNISWHDESIDEIESGSTELDSSALATAVVWATYVDGSLLDADRVAWLIDLFRQTLELGRTESWAWPSFICRAKRMVGQLRTQTRKGVAPSGLSILNRVL